MPGTTIGDGSVIGANSLVAGTIPPCSLAVGTPAQVIRSAPQFPPTVTAAQQAALVTTMMDEFERFAAYKGVRIADAGPFRTFARSRRTWRLLWLRDGETDVWATATGDTVVSESPLSPEVRETLRARGAHWLDLAGRTRSAAGSPLTEELALFIRRYGIRLPRA
jgi:hypothetical protein